MAGTLPMGGRGGSGSGNSTRALDYGVYSLSADKTIAGETTGSPVDTVVRSAGELSLVTAGVTIKSGRTYRIKVFGQLFYDNTGLRTEFVIYDITNAATISEEALSAVTEAVLNDNRTTLPYVETIYTAPNDCVIGIYASRSGRPVTCLAGFVTMIVEEVVTTVSA